MAQSDVDAGDKLSHYRAGSAVPGDSDRPETGYDTRALAEKVHGLLAQLHIDRYFIAAHDVGAWVAWPYAALYRDEVRALALLDAGIPGVTLPDALPVSPDKARKTRTSPFM